MEQALFDGDSAGIRRVLLTFVHAKRIPSLAAWLSLYALASSARMAAIVAA